MKALAAALVLGWLGLVLVTGSCGHASRLDAIPAVLR